MNDQPARSNTESSLFLQAVLIGGFIFICLMLFALARSIYRDSFQVGSYINELQKNITTESEATFNEEDELAYAKTPQFQEKMAKDLLGLKLPGEEVIVLTHEEQNVDDLLPEAAKKRQNELALLTTPQKWLKYLFGI